MSTTEQREPLQTLEGALERLTYQNEENGYTVARLVPKGKSYEVTVIGALGGVSAGETLQLRGTWTTHPRYGRQFEIKSYTVKLPATVEGIRKYLGSGMIRGVGPVTAGRIVDHFGLDTLEVIEADVERLREIPGVGLKRAALIAQAWEEQKQIKEVILFLQSQGISTSLAVKIYKQYGDSAIQMVKTAPYQLARDIYGIGFLTADKIAQEMGIALDAPERIQAGVRYALSAFSDDGHCYGARAALIGAAAELLQLAPEICETQLDALIAAHDVVSIEIDEEAGAKDGRNAIYLPPLYHAETGVVNKIRQLQESALDHLDVFQETDWDLAFEWLAGRQPIHLVPAQEAAIKMALTSRVAVLTGGPGTGKSTIMGSLIALAHAKQRTVLLAAPTGRAAKRLSETTGLPAKTIHRLLEYRPAQGSTFLRDRENPLDADLIIVDEASMIDILLMNHLTKAIGAGTHLLLVGDADQLPSVGPGNVLHDLIASGTVPVTTLDTIFRQSENSYIVVNAHRINHGEMPITSGEALDFYLFRTSDAGKAADLIVDIVANRVPAKFGFDPKNEIQVLSPMHRGDCGVSTLNERLQTTLNPPAPDRPSIPHGSRTFRAGDRVMQIRNDYDRNVFNGDMGVVTALDLEDRTVSIDFDGVVVKYEMTDLDEVVHAYAVSIHKSQGSEFPVVVIPILTQHYVMLQRNLLYTAVTRARKLVVLVGDHRAIAIAVQNNRISQRNTRLADRLPEGAP